MSVVRRRIFGYGQLHKKGVIMQFVRTDELRVGMRLARPIYNKKGVLLFERNSKLTPQAIESVNNFGLLGIYVLDPAEPLPPMSEEDIEFERFQTMSVFSIKEEIEKILDTGKRGRLEFIVGMLVKRFGHLDGKINFYQNLRSKDDYIYRHSLNVAILCAMMTHVLNVRLDEQNAVMHAALIHDIGKLKISQDVLYDQTMTEEMHLHILNAQSQDADLIERTVSDGVVVRRICMQALRIQMDMLKGMKDIQTAKLSMGAKILLVANRYDELTAMSLSGTAESEVKALKEFRDRPDVYDPQVVDALIRCINILTPGSSVILNTGEKALVLSENSRDILRPMVLSLQDNSIIDLGLKVNWDIEIDDIMKTMDNRYIINTDALALAGYLKKEGE